MDESETLSEYVALPLIIPPTRAYKQEATHYLYIRPHDPRKPDADSPRSLYVSNVPVDSTETHFKVLFANELGGSRIEHVDFDDAAPSNTKSGSRLDGDLTIQRKGKKRKREAEAKTDEPLKLELPSTWDRKLHYSGCNAVLVFIDKPSAHAAFKAVTRAAKKGQKLEWKEPERGEPSLGVRRYVAHQELMYPSSAELQAAVDAYMTAFGERELAQQKELARKRMQPDEDGFITVVRGGRTGPAKTEEAEEVLEKQKQREQKKRDSMNDFYRFQVREKQKERQKVLIREFEEDRKKVHEMRRRSKKGNDAFMPMD